MSARTRRSTASYARAVERAFAALSGRAAVLSPRDWALVATWDARGVPLACVLEAIAAARAKGRAPRALSALAREVEAVWDGVRSGRSTGPAEPLSILPRARETLDLWRRAAEAAPPESRLRSAIESAAAMAVASTDADAVDEFLDEALFGAAPADWIEEESRRAELALRGFRGRMPANILEATRRRSIVDRLRDRIGLPRLNLSRRVLD